MAMLKRFWAAEVVDMTSTTIPNIIVELLPGEAVTIKNCAGSANAVYLGPDNTVTATHGYKLEQGEVISFALDNDAEPGTKMEIWGLAANAGDDVCYVKIIGKAPETEAT